ncbi:MAG: hypothetical protein JW924_15215 [Fusobacteriaceae bacterium]|nr:hypothetical protein [Fusobacteriaceae bacterium]
MESKVKVKIERTVEDILLENGYVTEIKNENLMLVTLKNIEAKVAIIEDNNKLYFQLDVLPLSEIKDNVSFYKDLLVLNYDLLPLTVAIDTTVEDDNVLIITTTLESENLLENELLVVIGSFEESLGDLIEVLHRYYVDDLKFREGDTFGLY